MNKHLKFLMVAAVAVITVSSCKKDKTEDTTTDGGCKITNLKYYDDDNQLESSTGFSYDAMGRIIKFSDESGNSSTVTYATNKITLIDNDGDKNELTVENGKVVKWIEVGDSDYEAYSYNSEGYLVAIKRYDPTQPVQEESTKEIIYSGGNVSKVTEVRSSGARSVNTYEYSTDLAPSTLFVASPIYELTDQYLPGNHFGKESKNLLTKFSGTYTSNDPVNPTNSKFVTTYFYTKDAKGNYSTVTINTAYTDIVNGQEVTNTYREKYDLTYTCN